MVLDAGNDAVIADPVLPELAERGAFEGLSDAARVVQCGHAVMQKSENPPRRLRVEVLSSSVGAWQTWPMNRDTLSDHGYRLPPEIISHAVWLSHRVGVSVRAVEDLPGPPRPHGVLRHDAAAVGDIGPLDEGFVTLQRQRRSLWRTVDSSG